MNPLRRFRVVSWLLLAAVPLAAQTKEQFNRTQVGRVTDWSYGHIVVSGGASAVNLEAARTEPRILFHLVERNLSRVHDGTLSSSPALRDGENHVSAIPPNHPIIIDGTNVRNMKKRNLRTDWSLSLGTGSVAQAMFPPSSDSTSTVPRAVPMILWCSA
jgi:hypothetical protein